MYYRPANYNVGFSRPPIQRGEGISSFLGTLFRRLTPVAKKAANLTAKALSSDTAKEIANAGLNLSTNVSF